METYPCKDKNRLEFGSILPDAAVTGSSHLKILISGGTQKTYDLTRFRADFLPKMLEDDLYLGYYLHLIQDLFFRDFVYHRYHWDPRPSGNVEKLHNDYALINRYVIEKYALSNEIKIPTSFHKEPLNNLADFAVEKFLDKINADFNNEPSGEIFFFTEKMADEFIAHAAEGCRKELYALHHNFDCIDEMAMAWERLA